MKIHILSVAFCSIIITTALLVTHAEAQSVALPDELQAIYACKSISSAQERLASVSYTHLTLPTILLV